MAAGRMRGDASMLHRLQDSLLDIQIFYIFIEGMALRYEDCRIKSAEVHTGHT